jgi:cysteine synthase A
VPAILDREVIDEVVTISDDDAAQTMRRLAEEGLLVGPFSGANTFAVLRVAQRLGAGKRVVTVWPDTGERHLSLPL